jgi:uncharacterized protein YeaO (DUF488 family)
VSPAARPNPRVRRVYDPPQPDDGARVLVDRLWPRGLSKEEPELDDWPKALTPSNELRRWHHATDEGDGAFAEFRKRYLAELAELSRRQRSTLCARRSRQAPSPC